LEYASPVVVASPQQPHPSLAPDQALAQGHWVKWIGGASNQDLASIEDLAGIYSLVGVHCLDLACDPAVVAAARRGMAWASDQAPPGWTPPWLMVSLNDGADPHFRKAWFDPQRCPPDCSRPCASVCPALAIALAPCHHSGVLAESCYGCGRCLPVCPLGLIEERQILLEPAAVATRLAEIRPDAIELHTRPGRQAAFEARLAQVRAAGIPLRRLAVSCGLEASGSGSDPALANLAQELWQRFNAVRRFDFLPLWQLDGRPMSGDIGAGTAAAAVSLLRRLAPSAPPGPLTLAGGTNARTLELLEADGATGHRAAGVAFGGAARALLQPLLLQAQARQRRLLDCPDLLPQALELAHNLVDPWLARAQQPPQAVALARTTPEPAPARRQR
jgi:Fe-S-cluster-containing hydrogenase component 2